MRLPNAAATTFVVDVCTLAVPVDGHDEFGRLVERADSVGRHRGDLGGFTSLDDDVSLAEQQSHPSCGEVAG